MAYTIPPFNVNSSTWTNYKVQKNCSSILVKEQGGASVDYLVATLDKAGNMESSNYWTREAGKDFVIPGNFQRNDQPFAIKTASGSVTFDGIETP